MKVWEKILLSVELIIITISLIVVDNKNEILSATLNKNYNQHNLEISQINSKITQSHEDIMELTDIMTKLIDNISEERNNHVRNLMDEKINNFIKENKQIFIEQKLLMVNIFIINESIGALGSGVSLKYKDNYYILTAAHLIDNPEDVLYLTENRNKICQLEIINVDYDIDLAVLRPKDRDIVPSVYTELRDYEPIQAEQLYVVGNPDGVEDVLGECRVIAYTENFMYIQGTIFFGNSGGGVYDKQGKLVGIVSHMKIEDPNGPIYQYPQKPLFIIGGMVRIQAIRNFLAEID